MILKIYRVLLVREALEYSWLHNQRTKHATEPL